MTSVSFPYAFDHRGRTAESSDDRLIRQMIEQVLFTAPGERVNRPDFGAGLNRLVFAPNGDALAAATQLVAQASLQQHMGDLIQVEAVEVEALDATLVVTVRYRVRRTQELRLAEFRTQGGMA
jgi:uncharacterized protein